LSNCVGEAGAQMNSAGIPDDSWAHSDSKDKEPAAVELCSGCGLPLTPQSRGRHGECLRCAIGWALNRSDAPLIDKAGTDKTETKPSGATIRYHHFEVLLGPDGEPEELGAGGMATTYRARDTVLESLVALKIIRRKIADNSIARSRFLREARAAAKLRHPNVGSVFHYGEQDGECYYVMELIRGETLTERVQSKGVFTPKQALEVGVQVARALAAAESYGLVHRDIKPSNLMLESDPDADKSGGADKREVERIQVKVIDWGLAKSVSAEDELFGLDQTREGFIGTPGFASPEQFTRPAENRVDTRSDIYSLGVTLWYLLCGRTPLVGETLEAIHQRQKELPWEQLRNVKVPGRLIEVLRTILAFDPASRPQSARELLDLLRRCQQRLDAVPAQTLKKHRWRLALPMTLIGLVVAGVGFWGQRAWQYLANGVGVKPSLAMLPFENLSPDPTHAFFTVGIQYEINDSLAKVSGLNVLSAGSTAAYAAGRPRDYAAIGRALGVKHLIEGSVRRASERVTISVRSVDSDHPDRVWENQADGALTEVFSLQSKLVRGLIAHLKTSLSPEENRRIGQPLTNDPVALDFYLKATALEKTALIPNDEIQLEHQRISLLKSAVEKDPKFVRAYCELAEDYLYLYDHRQVLPSDQKTVDYRGLAEIALAQARRLQPDGGEVHLGTADLLYLASQDPDQAWVEVELAQKALPNDVRVYRLMGLIRYSQGRWRQATECSGRACSLDPTDWFMRLDLAHQYRHLRRYNDFERELKRALETMPPEMSPYVKLARALAAVEQGNLAPLQNELAALPSAKDPDGRLAFVIGFTLHLLERDADAIALSLTKYKVDPVRDGTHFYPRAWYQARLDRLRGDNAQAQKDFTIARDWMEKQVIANPTSGWALSMLALFDAGLGRKDEATVEALRAVELEPYGQHLDEASFVRGNLALIYTWTGRTSQALETLESIADKPGNFDIPSQPSYGDLLLNPCWDSLHGDPRFQRLLERFQKPVAGS
jgi:serine/threonine protein kinase/tetratricopeptide (TPR) repeat protein